MAQISPSYAIELQKKHNLKYWKVYDRYKKEIDKNLTDMTIRASGELLIKTLDEINGDTVTVVFYGEIPKKGGEQGERLEVTIRLHDIVTAQKSTGNNGISVSDLLNAQKEIYETRLELEKERLKQQEQPERISGIDRIINQVVEGGHLPGIIAAFTNMGKKHIEQPTVNGPNDFTQTLDKFAKVDPNYQDTLKKMAEYLEKNPGVLPQIKTIIGA